MYVPFYPRQSVVDGLLLKLSFDGHVAWDTKRCILRLSENMLPIAIFQCYFCGLFEATFVVTKKEIHIPRSRCNFVSVMFTTYTQEYIIYSSPFGCVFLFIAPEKRFGRARHIQTSSGKCLGNPPNSDTIHDDLYQDQLSGCSVQPASRWQTLPHPYSPLKNHAVFRINRNPGLGI